MSFYLQLILGGARSGKSRYALDPGQETPFRPKIFLATATSDDAEMGERIERHRKERGKDWRTFEEPYDLLKALRLLARSPKGLVVVDCTTLWISNLLCGVGGKSMAPASIRKEFRSLLRVLPRLKGEVRIVSNEVGWGIVPSNPLSRRFQDLQGELNASLASIAHRVVLMAAGLPVRIK